ncbi:MAG: glycosyltransferase family 2 protein, partial [Thermodesulfobacteriota bacterium]|nr:glycosyltransferase family 2 protein [Thermodesulfobacteriota bacterium]
MPKISVVIFSFNFENYLEECIESVLAQTLGPFEVIICDDCSSDESWTIISEYAGKFPVLIKPYRHERNIGMQRNGNFGLMKAKGELVSWLDGDDRWLPRKLELEWKALQNCPDARIAYSNVYTIDTAGNRTGIWHVKNGPNPPVGDVFVEVFSRRFFNNTSSLFRNELVHHSVYDEVGYFDENVEIFIDYDLKLRATSQFLVTYSGQPLIEYRFHEQGIHNSPPENLDRDQLYVYKKNLHLLDSRPEQEAIEIKRQWTAFEQHVKNADNIITCTCPHCKETLNISHEGSWQCP